MKVFVKPVLGVLIFVLLQLLTGLAIKLFFMPLTPKKLAASIIVSGIITVLILYRMRMIRRWTVYPMDIKWRYTPSAFAAAIFGIFAGNVLSEYLNLPNPMKMEFFSMIKDSWGIFAITVVGPIVEELVFREAFIGYTTRHRVPREAAILLSALAFSLIHLNPAQMPFAFIMGILLGLIYAKTKSVVITSIIHIANNSLAVWEMKKLGFKIDEFSYTDILGGERNALIFILISTALCILFLREFYRKYHYSHHKAKKRHHHHHHHS